MLKCKKGYEVSPLKSAAGYYIGTTDEEGFPNCRLSGYAKKEEDAKHLFLDHMFAEENFFCNRGDCCLREQ